MGCVFFLIAEMLLKLAIDINQSINQSINSNQAYQHSETGKYWERSVIKPDLKPIFVNSYITELKATCVIKNKHKTFVDYL
jgi:hypothetical protein